MAKIFACFSDKTTLFKFLENYNFFGCLKFKDVYTGPCFSERFVCKFVK